MVSTYTLRYIARYFGIWHTLPYGAAIVFLDYCGTCPFGHGSIVMHHSLVYGPAVQLGLLSLFA